MEAAVAAARGRRRALELGHGVAGRRGIIPRRSGAGGSSVTIQTMRASTQAAPRSAGAAPADGVLVGAGTKTWSLSRSSSASRTRGVPWTRARAGAPPGPVLAHPRDDDRQLAASRPTPAAYRGGRAVRPPQPVQLSRHVSDWAPSATKNQPALAGGPATMRAQDHLRSDGSPTLKCPRRSRHPMYSTVPCRTSRCRR